MKFNYVLDLNESKLLSQKAKIQLECNNYALQHLHPLTTRCTK